jgi:hypothetical protein
MAGRERQNEVVGVKGLQGQERVAIWVGVIVARARYSAKWFHQGDQSNSFKVLFGAVSDRYLGGDL